MIYRVDLLQYHIMGRIRVIVTMVGEVTESKNQFAEHMRPVEVKWGLKGFQRGILPFYLTAIHEYCGIFVDLRIRLDVHGSYWLFGFFWAGRASHTLWFEK